MKRVTIFTAFDTALNPYILLFKEALEAQGLYVRFDRNFNLNWLLTNGESYDCIHLHWLNLFHTTPKNKDGLRSYKKLIGNRTVKAFLDFLVLIDFLLAFFFAKLKGKIIVFTVHDLYDFDKKSLRRRLHIELAHNIVFRFSNSVHVHSHFTRKLIETRYKKKTGVYVIPHGNYIGYYSNRISQSEARLRLGLPDDALVFLFLGLIRPYKGLEDLFEAFKNLDYPEARLLVAGRVFGADSYESELRTLAQSDPRIKLAMEFVPDDAIQIYLNACNFFVLPYKDITTSGAAALGLSFGRPIIAPSIASFPEVVTTESGLLYDPSQPKYLTAALRKARDLPFSESKIISYAHQFDWNKLGSDLARLYKMPNKEYSMNSNPDTGN